MTKDDPKSALERRNDNRVDYTAILGFKELKGQKIPPNPSRPNAKGTDLSLGGICFESKKRPKSEHVILYLPDGARAVARVANITQDVDSLEYSCHCEVVQWLPKGATTLERPNPKPVHQPPATQDDE